MSNLTDRVPAIDWRDLAHLVDAGRQYKNAPIAEAIWEIQVVLPEHIDLNRLSHAADGLSSFSVLGTQDELLLRMGPAGGGGELETATLGHVFADQGEKRFIRAHLDRFAFACRAPYEGWKRFSEEATEAWIAYAAVSEPTRTTRLAVRFINRIEIPQPSFEVMDYVRTGIDVSRYLPQAISSYFMQVDVVLGASDVTARISSALGGPPRPGYSSLILDIDAFRLSEIDLLDGRTEVQLAEHMEILHDAKNYVFESCITDATRGLIR